MKIAMQLPMSEQRRANSQRVASLFFIFNLAKKNQFWHKYYLFPFTTVRSAFFFSSSQMQLCLRMHTFSRIHTGGYL